MTASTPAPAELSRRERRKLEVRGRILEAAGELFVAQGFHATRVAEICDRADVAQKTFFNHFPSKMHLLREMATYGLLELLEKVEALRKQEATTRDRLRAVFGEIATTTSDSGPMNRELLTELVHVMNESAEKGEHARRLHDAFGAIVTDGLAAGEVTRRHDAETLTEMILGAYYVLMFNYANLDDFPIRLQAEAVANFLGDAIAPQPDEEE